MIHQRCATRLPLATNSQASTNLCICLPLDLLSSPLSCYVALLSVSTLLSQQQDGFLVEALKLPNLLAEFEYQDHTPINVRGSLRQQSTANRIGLAAKLGQKLKVPGSEVPVQGPALVGFREWVFSEDSGALAEFAAATERSFGTTVQRVMHNPGGSMCAHGWLWVWRYGL